MSPKLTEIFNSGDRGQIRLQYDEENGELYVNDKKVLYEVALSRWQKILAFSVSIALVLQGAMAALTFFFRDWANLKNIL